MHNVVIRMRSGARHVVKHTAQSLEEILEEVASKEYFTYTEKETFVAINSHYIESIMLMENTNGRKGT